MDKNTKEIIAGLFVCILFFGMVIWINRPNQRIGYSSYTPSLVRSDHTTSTLRTAGRTLKPTQSATRSFSVASHVTSSDSVILELSQNTGIRSTTSTTNTIDVIEFWINGSKVGHIGEDGAYVDDVN